MLRVFQKITENNTATSATNHPFLSQQHHIPSNITGKSACKNNKTSQKTLSFFLLLALQILVLYINTTINEYTWSSSTNIIITNNIIVSANALVASGTAINLATIGDFRNNTVIGQVVGSIALGAQVSFHINNNQRNGIRGRPVHLHVLSTNDNMSSIAPLMASLTASVPNMVAILHALGEVTVLNTLDFIDTMPEEKRMMIIQPSAATRRFFSYSYSYANVIPDVDAEITAGIRHLVYRHQISRFAVVSDGDMILGTELVPDIRRLLAGVGANLTYHYKLHVYTSEVDGDLVTLSQMFATKPHAVLLLGALYTSSVVTFLRILQALPNTYIFSMGGLMSIIDIGLRMLPTSSLPAIVQERIVLTSVGPFYSDSTSMVVRRFRQEYEESMSHFGAKSLAYLDATPIVGTMVFMGWLMGEVTGQTLMKTENISGSAFQEAFFTDSIFAVDDYVLGPYSGPCIGSRKVFCSCNCGVRSVTLVQYTPTLSLMQVGGKGVDLTLEPGICTGTGIILPSPLVILFVEPVNNSGASLDLVAAGFLDGRQKAAINGLITTDGVIARRFYTGNSTTALQMLFTEQLISVAAGCITTGPLEENAKGVGALIDPFDPRPRLYSGYRREVIHVSPTYDQEIHALAFTAVQLGVGVSTMSTLNDGEAVNHAFTMSMNTFGRHGGSYKYVTSIQAGLETHSGESGITLLHGIETESDILAIATYLARTQSNVFVAIPMPHLEVWYIHLQNNISDSAHRSRVLFATSLPNWAGAVGSVVGTEIATFFERVPAANRTPSTLRGYMTQQLIRYVASRVPSQKTSEEFIKMLYGASVVVMDVGLVAGPYFDAACVRATDETCEMNIGARAIRVRSLAACDDAAPGEDLYRITLDSGRISYQGLPPNSSTAISTLIVAVVVGCILVALGALIVLLICMCSGRSNWSAPKNEKVAFTIIFTDIQSSTTLWAAAPEAMAPTMELHHKTIRRICRKHNGYEVKTIGDAFMIACNDAFNAVALACNIQGAFMETKWAPEIDSVYLKMESRITSGMTTEEASVYPIALSDEEYCQQWNGLRVRIGLHTGFGEIKKDPVSHGYDYYGTVVNTASRIEAIANGGQIVISEATFEASRLPSHCVIPLGPVLLRGVPDKVEVYQLNTVPGRVFPPLRLDTPCEAGEGDEECDDLSHSVSSRSSAPVAVTAQHLNVSTLLQMMMSAIPERQRDNWIADLTKKWRVPEPFGRPSRESMINNLSWKLAPIMAKKIALQASLHEEGPPPNSMHQRSMLSQAPVTRFSRYSFSQALRQSIAEGNGVKPFAQTVEGDVEKPCGVDAGVAFGMVDEM